jgi:flagellar motor protein MotB
MSDTLERALPRLVARLELADATRLARSGRYGEAEATLVVSRSLPAGLDLRARMAAQQGRYDDASDLWHKAAELVGDTDAFAAEQATVTHLGKRRFRAGPLLLVGLVLTGAVVGWGIGRGASSSDSSSNEPAVTAAGEADELSTAADGQSDPDWDEQFDQVLDLLQPADSGEVVQALAGVDDAEVVPSAQALNVQVDVPVFSSGLSMTAEGEQVLAGMAAALRRSDGYVVTVTGHSDTTPLPPGGPWADNGELSLARARAAVSLLVDHGVPGEQIFVRVTDVPLPYPADPTDPRNRTVTLTVYELPQ